MKISLKYNMISYLNLISYCLKVKIQSQSTKIRIYKFGKTLPFIL
jgi:hypothetical protein